jgi:hypothetical protein
VHIVFFYDVGFAFRLELQVGLPSLSLLCLYSVPYVSTPVLSHSLSPHFVHFRQYSAKSSRPVACGS